MYIPAFSRAKLHSPLRHLLLLLAFALVSVVIVGTASAHNEVTILDADPDPLPGSLLTNAQALRFDAEAVAKDLGVSVGTAENGLRFQDRYSVLMGSLGSDDSERFAGARIDLTRQSATVFFKGSDPVEVASRILEQGLSIEIADGLRFSLVELQDQQMIAHEALVSAGFVSAVSTVNIETQTIRIDVARAPVMNGLDTSEVQRVAADSVDVSLTQAGIADTTRATIDISVVGDVPLSATTHTHGGSWMRDDGADECTSAFSIERGSVDGILLASHCEGINQIVEHYSGGGVKKSYSAPWSAEHIGANGDIEWHTTQHYEIAEFWSNTSWKRNVTGRLANTAIAEDMSMCKYGRAGGYDCGQVENVSITISFLWEGCNCTRTASNMVEARNVTSTPGDSGGPVFASTTAYGIIHGNIISNGHLVYTPIQRAETQFNATVLTK